MKFFVLLVNELHFGKKDSIIAIAMVPHALQRL